jgi:hypothetical protein
MGEDFHSSHDTLVRGPGPIYRPVFLTEQEEEDIAALGLVAVAAATVALVMVKAASFLALKRRHASR